MNSTHIGIGIVVIFLLIWGGVSLIRGGENHANDIGYAEEAIEQAQRNRTVTNSNTLENMEVQKATLQTSMGDIEVELFTEATPITAGNFISLAEAGFYTDVKFHRVIPGFMAQAGDPLTKDDSQEALWGTGGPGYTIEDEFVPGLSNVRGTLSMANAGPNTGGSQFFINVADNTFLDGKHAVFGRVVSGMDIVDAMVTVETDGQDRPVEAIVIQEVIL